MKFKDCRSNDMKKFVHNMQIFGKHKNLAKAKRKAERQNRKRGRK